MTIIGERYIALKKIFLCQLSVRNQRNSSEFQTIKSSDLREFLFIFSFKGSDYFKLEKNKFIFHEFKILFDIKCFIKKHKYQLPINDYLK